MLYVPYLLVLENALGPFQMDHLQIAQILIGMVPDILFHGTRRAETPQQLLSHQIQQPSNFHSWFLRPVKRTYVTYYIHLSVKCISCSCHSATVKFARTFLLPDRHCSWNELERNGVASDGKDSSSRWKELPCVRA